jgi:hypothetical protein
VILLAGRNAAGGEDQVVLPATSCSARERGAIIP